MCCLASLVVSSDDTPAWGTLDCLNRQPHHRAGGCVLSSLATPVGNRMRSWSSGQRPSTGHRFQAAVVAAPALVAVAAWHMDVSNVAGGSHGAPVQHAVDDDAATNAGADLDEEQVRHLRIALLVFAQCHQVDVVVDDGLRGVALREVIGHAVAVPPGHEGRANHGPGGELHRTRHADRDGAHPPRVGSNLGE